MPVTTIVGIMLIAAGAVVSLATLAHDVRRLRIGARVPQAAPSRVPPEVHALGAVVTAAGAWAVAGWLIGLFVLIAHAIIAYGIAPWVVDRLSDA